MRIRPLLLHKNPTKNPMKRIVSLTCHWLVLVPSLYFYFDLFSNFLILCKNTLFVYSFKCQVATCRLWLHLLQCIAFFHYNLPMKKPTVHCNKCMQVTAWLNIQYNKMAISKILYLKKQFQQ